MVSWLDELLWARGCVKEILGSTVIGMLVGGCLQIGHMAPLLSSLITAVVSVLVFTLLVGERLTRTPEESEV